MPGRGRTALAVAAAMALLVSAPAAQTRQSSGGRDPGTGIITGVVVDATTGRGVANVAVRATGRNTRQTRLTDARGRFYFKFLPGGDVTITAEKAGYTDGAFGKRRAAGSGIPLTLFPGQVVVDIRIELFRPATISGMVADESGEPLVGVNVRAVRREYVDGVWKYSDSRTETTDDRGDFRLFDLVPGEYLVLVPAVQITVPTETVDLVNSAVSMTSEIQAALNANGVPLMSDLLPSNDGHRLLVTTRAAPTPPDERGKPTAYHTQYFPGGDRLSMAQSILVGPGEHYPGLFFQMLPYPTTQVSGIVIGPDGRPASNQLMRLLYADDDDIASGSEAAITLSAMDGTFTFLNVAAGRYTLDARGRRVQAAADGGVPLLVAGDLVMWGKTALAVGEEPIADLELRVDVAPTVYGHVVFDGLAPPARDERAALRLAVESINGVRTLQSILDDGGGFKLEGLVPGEYRLRLTLPPGWQQKSVTVGLRDHTDAPLRIEAGEIPGDVVITLTDHPTRIAGYVRDSRYFVVPGATVIVQPIVRGTDTAAAAEARRARLVRADASGLYIIDSLAPGEYSLSAIDEAKAEGWQDPKRLQALRNAGLRITVKEGDYQLVDLRLR